MPVRLTVALLPVEPSVVVFKIVVGTTMTAPPVMVKTLMDMARRINIERIAAVGYREAGRALEVVNPAGSPVRSI